MKSYNTMTEIQNELNNQALTVLVFSTRGCSVCKPLKVKLSAIVENLRDVTIGSIFIEDIPEAKGEYGVYTAPITILFVEGKEAKRYSAAMDINEFENVLKRYIDLMS